MLLADWQEDPYVQTWFKGLAEQTQTTYSACMQKRLIDVPLEPLSFPRRDILDLARQI